jgi:hypothetical protein
MSRKTDNPKRHATSSVDTLWMYKMLWHALDGRDTAFAVSRIMDEMARLHLEDTGVFAGPASENAYPYDILDELSDCDPESRLSKPNTSSAREELRVRRAVSLEQKAEA